MHEITITQNILNFALREAEKHHASKVRTITLALGPFSGFVPECIEMYMEVLAKDTPAQGVQIKVREIPLKVRCNNCKKESEIDRKHIECPYCHSIDLMRLSGSECMIETIEVE